MVKSKEWGGFKRPPLYNWVPFPVRTTRRILKVRALYLKLKWRGDVENVSHKVFLPVDRSLHRRNWVTTLRGPVTHLISHSIGYEVKENKTQNTIYICVLRIRRLGLGRWRKMTPTLFSHNVLNTNYFYFFSLSRLIIIYLHCAHG